MDTAFSDQQYDLYYPPGIERHWWSLARNRLLAGILKREIRAGDGILEVGCGTGVVVKNLHERGFNIRGVELAPVTPMAGAESLIDPGTDAFDLPVEQRAGISALLLLDVLEHLPDVESFLQKLQDSFPNIELVVVTVPARDEIWSNYDPLVGHYRRYSLEMLEKLSVDLGWSTEKAGYFFRISYLPMRLMSLLGVDRNTSFNPPGKVVQPLHHLVSAFCQLEQVVLPSRLRGSSAYAVYRLGKPA